MSFNSADRRTAFYTNIFTTFMRDSEWKASLAETSFTVAIAVSPASAKPSRLQLKLSK